MLCWCVSMHKDNLIYYQCNIVWVLSLCNTSWLNTETTNFEFYSQWNCTWLPRVSILTSKNLNWSTLLVYRIFFCHFKPYYRVSQLGSSGEGGRGDNLGKMGKYYIKITKSAFFLINLQVFPCEFCKFLRTHYLHNSSGPLLLLLI